MIDFYKLLKSTSGLDMIKGLRAKYEVSLNY